MIRLCFFLFILTTQFFSVTVTKAQDGSCQPGTSCLFTLGTEGSKCRLNEDLFFTRTDRWEIPAHGYDYFNYRFGPFTKNNGYVSPGGWQGGCICNVATWLNYFLKVNDITTIVDAPYHKSYDFPGVPNTGTEYNKLYFVTVQHPDTTKPKSLEKWGYDLRVENNSSKPLIIRWEIIDDPENKTDYVNIWLEEEVVTIAPTPTMETVQEVTTEESPQLEPTVMPSSVESSLPETPEIVLPEADVSRPNLLWIAVLVVALMVFIRFIRPA